MSAWHFIRKHYEECNVMVCGKCGAMLLDKSWYDLHEKWHADTNVEVRRGHYTMTQLDKTYNSFFGLPDYGAGPWSCSDFWRSR